MSWGDKNKYCKTTDPKHFSSRAIWYISNIFSRPYFILLAFSSSISYIWNIFLGWTRHAGHCWRSRDELIRDVLLWTPTHGRAKAGRPARTYIQQLCEDTGCCPEDLPRAMNDREEWRERVRDIRATSAIWWWWWYRIFLAFSSFMSSLLNIFPGYIVYFKHFLQLNKNLFLINELAILLEVSRITSTIIARIWNIDNILK